MGPQPDRPISDPLLRPDSAPRDVHGAPVRAPLGNSIRTLLAFAVLLAIGIGVWWVRRPADIADQLGGREWAITAIDGEPAINHVGLVSTFVLDGNGEVRGVLDCNVTSGTWSFDASRTRLELEWTTQTTMGCADDWPTTYLPTDGDVSMHAGTIRIDSGSTVVEAVALADREPIEIDEITGTWVSGDQSIEIGRRGLFEIDTCSGTWSTPEDEDDPSMLIQFDDVQRDDCMLGSIWAGELSVVPVLHDGSLYLRRDRAIFPVDRDIIRLDQVG